MTMINEYIYIVVHNGHIKYFNLTSIFNHRLP